MIATLKFSDHRCPTDAFVPCRSVVVTLGERSPPYKNHHFLKGISKNPKHRELGLFDIDFRIEKLIKLGDPLHRLSLGIDFELFRPLLEESLYKEPKGLGTRPSYDYVLMFKILILQRYFNLSDELIDEKDAHQPLYADSAYTGVDLHNRLIKKDMDLKQSIT